MVLTKPGGEAVVLRGRSNSVGLETGADSEGAFGL